MFLKPTFSIFKTRGKIDDQVWRFLLTGGVALENPYPNPAPGWMTDKAWSEVVRSSNLLNLKGFKARMYSSLFTRSMVSGCCQVYYAKFIHMKLSKSKEQRACLHHFAL